jgi:hypothetical protein
MSLRQRPIGGFKTPHEANDCVAELKYLVISVLQKCIRLIILHSGYSGSGLLKIKSLISRLNVIWWYQDQNKKCKSEDNVHNIHYATSLQNKSSQIRKCAQERCPFSMLDCAASRRDTDQQSVISFDSVQVDVKKVVDSIEDARYGVVIDHTELHITGMAFVQHSFML